MTTQLILDGLTIGESPRWHDGRICLSDWNAGRILAVDDAGSATVMARPTWFPFSFDWLPDGTMVVTAGEGGKLWRLEPDGSFSVHADLSAVADDWNEIVVDGRGNVYVNGGGFDFSGDTTPKGVIALVSPSGDVRQVAESLAFPNGMVVTPDNRTLIVAESWAGCLTAYDIAEDGSLTNRRIWAAMQGSAPDGICIDAEGAVWYADVPNKHCQRVAEGGAVLDTVTVDRGCFACMIGDDTLYILAAEWHGFEETSSDERTGQLISVPAPAPRAGWP